MSISVDGSGETYEYIRWPGKWQKIINNINTLKKHNETHKNITYSFTTVVQNLNVDNLCDFIVDLVSSGKTLEQNNMAELQKIMDVSSYLIINRASFKVANEDINQLITIFNAA